MQFGQKAYRFQELLLCLWLSPPTLICPSGTVQIALMDAERCPRRDVQIIIVHPWHSRLAFTNAKMLTRNPIRPMVLGGNVEPMVKSALAALVLLLSVEAEAQAVYKSVDET